MFPVDMLNDSVMFAMSEPVTLDSGAVVDAIVDLIPGTTTVGNITIERHEPEMTVFTRDIESSGMAKNQTVTIRGRDYRIAALNPDDDGLTVVTLRELKQ